ncbi:early endosome antigen 1 [Brachyistius frenatus]|uniref:early endosome antigen 1 n=1 Tax=Brachyistius frenatus TaxID=100188 RepID=UPI0037E7980F
MFSKNSRSSSPFSLTDLDMWDTKSRFAAQTSAWCGMATVSGSGFLSEVSTSSGGLRQTDPGLRRWQSLYHLAPDSATQSFPRSRTELRAAQGESCFRKGEVVQWLQDAHERLDSQLDRLKMRDMQLGYNINTAQLFDMKHKQLSEAMSTLKKEKEAVELPQFEKSQPREELHEKVLKLEKDLLQMKSNLDKGSNEKPIERAPGYLSRTLPVSPEDVNRQKKQKVDAELCKLREPLRKAEEKAKTQEEERNKALQHLQTSTERTVLNQIEEMNKSFSHTVQNHSEVQEQLREANNKISQACLEKAILSTQMLKLEDNIKELKAKLTRALSDKDHLIKEKADLLQGAQGLDMQLGNTQHASEVCALQDHLSNAKCHNNKENQDTVLMKEDSTVLRKETEKLQVELEMIKRSLEISQHQLQELTDEKILNNKQIIDLETQRFQLVREKVELLSKIKEGGHKDLTEMKEKCCQHSESVEILQLENQKLHDQYLCLEAEVLEKEKMLHLQEEEYLKQDTVRVQSIEEMKAMASHWTEKWQKVALTLQSTQKELEEFKNNSKNEGESDSILRAELDACKQELEVERSRIQALLHKYEDKGGEAVQTQDKQTVTDLSESSLLWEPPSDSQSRQNNHQMCMQSRETQRLTQKLTEREEELSEKEHALKTLERLKEMEKAEAQIKISALELNLMKRFSEDDRRLQADVLTSDSLRVQLDESRRRANQLQQEKMLAVQRLQTLRQLHLVKDEEASVEGRRDKTVCPVNLETDQQRRMVTEQLKSLFKEREEQEAANVDNTAAQTESTSPQYWTPTSKVVRAAVDRRNWQQCSGLMPVFEEDEENNEFPGEEEGEPSEETYAEENLPDQEHQMSALTAQISNLKAKNKSRLQALRLKQPIQDPHAAGKVSHKPSPCLDEGDLQWRQTPPLYPDGIFLAELVDICSPDEDGEEVKLCVL